MDPSRILSGESSAVSGVLRPAEMVAGMAADPAAAWQALPALDKGASAQPGTGQIPLVPGSSGLANGLQTVMLQTQDGDEDAMAPAPGQAQSALPAVGTDPLPRATGAGVHMSIETPVRHPAFPQELAERIVWLSNRQGHMAAIALNPSHLGPLEVKLSLTAGEAGAQFFSPHPQVREAIEAALPRLREMLAEAGINLGQTQVRDEAFPRQELLDRGHDQPALVQGDWPGALISPSPSAAETRRLGLGLVDLYV